MSGSQSTGLERSLCWALTTIDGIPITSSTLYSGFQYDAVLSIATISQFLLFSQLATSNNSYVVVPKFRISDFLPQRRQATRSFLCTSTPLQVPYRTSILFASMLLCTARLSSFVILLYVLMLLDNWTGRGATGEPTSIWSAGYEPKNISTIAVVSIIHYFFSIVYPASWFHSSWLFACGV